VQELFTVAETAERLRLSRKSIYDRLERGELSALRLGEGPKAPLRITSSELDRFLEQAGKRQRKRVAA
jgi:excisionase family DNA binding protein